MRQFISSVSQLTLVQRLRQRQYEKQIGEDHGAFVAHLIAINKVKIGAEVGVWKGQTSKKILDKSQIEKLYMIDPYRLDLNHFNHKTKVGDPQTMPPGCYQCDMGGKLLAQNELDALYLNVREEMKPWGARAELLRLTSVEGAERLEDNSLDFVFIDAIHLYENVKEDINTWLPKVKQTGIIAGHDYGKDFPGVIAAVHELFPSKLVNVHPQSTVWNVRKAEFLNPNSKKNLFQMIWK
jgi:predicted O-methyltransferase YrrM